MSDYNKIGTPFELPGDDYISADRNSSVRLSNFSTNADDSYKDPATFTEV